MTKTIIERERDLTDYTLRKRLYIYFAMGCILPIVVLYERPHWVFMGMSLTTITIFFATYPDVAWAVARRSLPMIAGGIAALATLLISAVLLGFIYLKIRQSDTLPPEVDSILE